MNFKSIDIDPFLMSMVLKKIRFNRRAYDKLISILFEVHSGLGAFFFSSLQAFEYEL